MAKITGMVKLTGTIDDLNFYIRKGTAISRKAGGGFNGKKIRTSPRMARVRENGTEFKGCMQSVKHFKQGLQPYLAQVKDGTLHQRLASLFTKIKATDAMKARGEKTVGGGLLTPEGRQLLQGYTLHSGPSLARVLGQPFSFSWDSQGLAFADFNADATVFPKGATQLKLTALFYVFDFEKQESVLAASETKVILPGSGQNGPIALSAIALPKGPGIKTGLVLYRFLQEINGEMYVLKNQNSLGLEVVYVGGPGN